MRQALFGWALAASAIALAAPAVAQDRGDRHDGGGDRINMQQTWHGAFTPPAAQPTRQAPSDPAPQALRQDERRDWSGDRRDWSGDRRGDVQSDRHMDDRRYSPDNDRQDRYTGYSGPRFRVDRSSQQRDWNQGDSRWNDRRESVWRDTTRRDWSRDWRRESRYDWQRYRYFNRDAYRLPTYRAPYGWDRGYRSFSIGVYLDDILFDQSYWIDDPWAYRLPPAYGPLRWVRYYDDALLVDIRNGYVVDAIHHFFW